MLSHTGCPAPLALAVRSVVSNFLYYVVAAGPLYTLLRPEDEPSLPLKSSRWTWAGKNLEGWKERSTPDPEGESFRRLRYHHPRHDSSTDPQLRGSHIVRAPAQQSRLSLHHEGVRPVACPSTGRVVRAASTMLGVVLPLGCKACGGTYVLNSSLRRCVIRRGATLLRCQA